MPSPTARGCEFGPDRLLDPGAFGFPATGFGIKMEVLAARLVAGVATLGFEARHSVRHCPQTSAALGLLLPGRSGLSCRPATLRDAQFACISGAQLGP